MISVDSSILLGILRGEDANRWADLADLSSAHELAICGPVYAEISGAFDSRTDLDEFVSDSSLLLVHLSREALWEAGARFRAYLARRDAQCPECGATLPHRGVVATDFLIGALGHVDGDGIMTTDRRMRRWWPDATYF